jgi:hypothetical protein
MSTRKITVPIRPCRGVLKLWTPEQWCSYLGFIPFWRVSLQKLRSVWHQKNPRAYPADAARHTTLRVSSEYSPLLPRKHSHVA